MPRAPELQRQVVDAPAPNVRVGAAPTSETYGGQIGDTVSHAAVRMYDLQTRSSDHARVVEAETKANAEQLRIQQAVLNMKGKEAANAPQYAQEEWNKVHQDILGTLANDRQRAMYHSIGLAKGEMINRGALSHFNQEDERFQQETFKADIQSSIDVARANAESPTAVAFEKDMQAQRIDEHAAKFGYAGTPQHDAALIGVRSTTNREVIHGLLEKGQDLRANAYYTALLKQEHASPTQLQLTAPDRDIVEKAIFEGSTRGESRRQTQDILTKIGIETPDQRRDAIGAARAITNDKVSDATVQRLEHEFSVFDQRKSEDYSQGYLQASKIIEDQGLKQPRAGVRDLIPVPMWNSLTPEDQHNLELHLDRIRKPEDHPHDPKTWFDFQSLTDVQLAKVKPEKLMGTYLNHFDGTHYDRALAEWNAARNKVDKGDKDPKFISALTPREEIMNAWVNSGIVDNSIPRGKWTKEDETNYNRFESQAARALSALPKDAKPEEIQKVLKGLADAQLKQKYTVDPGIFSRNKQVPAIGMEDIKDARSIRIPLKEIPAPEQDTIKGLLRSGGKPITNDKIERIYALRKLQQGGQMSKEAATAAMKAIILE